MTTAPAVPSPPANHFSAHLSSLRKTSSRHVPQTSTSSLPTPARPVLPSSVKLSRTLSHPAATPTGHSTANAGRHQHRNDASSAQRTSLLSKTHARPSPSFGHAHTNEEPQITQRQRAQLYGSAPENTTAPASSSPVMNTGAAQKGALGLLIPRTHDATLVHEGHSGVQRQRNETSSTMRSAGSSFDVAVYAQMEELRHPEIEGDGKGFKRSVNLDLVEPVYTAAAEKATYNSRWTLSYASTSHSEDVALPCSDGAHASTSPYQHFSKLPQSSRKVSDGLYTHPRMAPEPPALGLSPKRTSTLALPSSPNRSGSGRPRSPARMRRERTSPQKGSRLRSQQEVIHISDDEEEKVFGFVTLSDEQAQRQIEEAEGVRSMVGGYARR